MRPYTIVYSDETFHLFFKEDKHSVTLGLKDSSKDFGSVQVLFPTVSSDNHELLSNALRNATAAFNNVFQAALRPMTEQEKELTFEEMSF
jgi:hypothetical protein